MRRSLLAVFGVILCFSCVREPAPDPADPPDRVSQSPYAISRTEALQNLADVLETIDTPQTRGGRAARRVKDVTAVSRADIFRASTRAGVYADDLEDKIYLVTFEEGEGSAVVAADTHLEPVIAIFDEYQVTLEDLQDIGQKADVEQTPQLAPEDFYCAEDDYYYLGMSNRPGEDFHFA